MTGTPLRVVSLVPSSTETLLALGADVVACTRFCEQPTILHVGGTKNPDIDAIVRLEPDLVVLDRQENRREDAEALAAAGVRIHVSDVVDLAGAAAVVSDLAAIVGAEWSAPDLGPPVDPPTVRVFVPIWRRPWMSIGPATYGASLLRHLGCTLTTDDATVDYPVVELDELATPELVLVPSEPYDFSDGHVAELRDAYPAVPVLRIDGQDLFWWGVRTPAALRRLAAAVQR